MGTIVFCEDDPMIQKLIRAALRSSPHTVHIAADGRQGLALIERTRPDVVFTDVSMPTCDGFQLADAMKAKAELDRIPIVFMTASVQREQVEECFRRGAAGYLAKPFTMADLRSRVDEFLSPARSGTT